MSFGDPEAPRAAGDESEDEPQRLRRLQLMMQMVQAVIAQSEITPDEAADLVQGARRAALALFPGKELAFDLIYRPRLDRLIAERFGLG